MAIPTIENTQFEQLLTLLTKINSESELHSILVTIMEAAKDIMKAEASSLMLVDEPSGDLVFAVPTGPASVDLSGKRVPKGKGIGGWVAQNNEWALVNDVQKDKRFLGNTDSKYQTRNLACVPMRNEKGVVIGVLQAINKVFGDFREEEITLFMALANQAAIAIEKARYQQEAIEKQRMEQEIQLARTIQTGLFPKTIPKIKGLDIAGKSISAKEVGGDYFDVIELSRNRALVIIGDVSGKGVGAALIMVELRAIFHLLAHSDIEFDELMTKINNMLVEDIPQNKFVTLFVGILDFENKELRYCNAGHNPPWLIYKDEIQILDEGGPIVGFMKNLSFDVATIPLKIGHELFIYTDGFSEGEREDEEQWGEENLLQAFRASKGNAEQRLNQVFKNLTDFVGDAEASDDRTAIVALVTGD